MKRSRVVRLVVVVLIRGGALGRLRGLDLFAKVSDLRLERCVVAFGLLDGRVLGLEGLQQLVELGLGEGRLARGWPGLGSGRGCTSPSSGRGRAGSNSETPPKRRSGEVAQDVESGLIVDRPGLVTATFPTLRMTVAFVEMSLPTRLRNGGWARRAARSDWYGVVSAASS